MRVWHVAARRDWAPSTRTRQSRRSVVARSWFNFFDTRAGYSSGRPSIPRLRRCVMSSQKNPTNWLIVHQGDCVRPIGAALVRYASPEWLRRGVGREPDCALVRPHMTCTSAWARSRPFTACRGPHRSAGRAETPRRQIRHVVVSNYKRGAQWPIYTRTLKFRP